VSTPHVVPDREPALDLLSEYGVTTVKVARGGSAWMGLGPAHACYLARSDEGVRRLAVESTRLAWAQGQGIAVPPPVGESPGLLVRARVPVDPVRGQGLVDAAVEVTRRIALASAPPPAPHESVSRRARNARTLPLRLSRGVVRGVPWGEFRLGRAEAALLPSTTLSHGDFQDDNLLWDEAHQQVHVIDWDYAALLPESTDLLNLWVQLVDDDTRDLVLDVALSETKDRAAFGVLAHWLALRHLAEVATGSPSSVGRVAWRGRLRNAKASLARARRLRAPG
jgi:hypothetical protein